MLQLQVLTLKMLIKTRECIKYFGQKIAKRISNILEKIAGSGWLFLCCVYYLVLPVSMEAC